MAFHDFPAWREVRIAPACAIPAIAQDVETELLVDVTDGASRLNQDVAAKFFQGEFAGLELAQ